MKLYAYSISAERVQNEGWGQKHYFYHSAGVLTAINENEATGMALAATKKTYPMNRGNYNHQTVVCVIPDDAILAAAEQIATEASAPAQGEL